MKREDLLNVMLRLSGLDGKEPVTPDDEIKISHQDEDLATVKKHAERAIRSVEFHSQMVSSCQSSKPN